MRRRLEEKGYELVWWLAMRKSRLGQWAHERWADFWYRHYCPYPIINDLRACACIKAGHCGCSNGPKH